MWEVVLLSLVANHCVSSDNFWYFTQKQEAPVEESARSIAASEPWNGSVLLCSSAPHFCLVLGHSTLNSPRNLMQQSSKKSVTIDCGKAPTLSTRWDQVSRGGQCPLSLLQQGPVPIPTWKCHLGCPLRLLPDLILCLAAHTSLPAQPIKHGRQGKRKMFLDGNTVL